MNIAGILNALTMIETIFSWLAKRGLNRARVSSLLEIANQAGRDITDQEVKDELSQTQIELTETQELLDEVFPDLLTDGEEFDPSD